MKKSGEDLHFVSGENLLFCGRRRRACGAAAAELLEFENDGAAADLVGWGMKDGCGRMRSGVVTRIGGVQRGSVVAGIARCGGNKQKREGGNVLGGEHAWCMIVGDVHTYM